MTDLYSPSQLAELLDTGSHHIRRYTDRFASYLSPVTRERPRRYSQFEAGVMARIVQLKAAGHTFAEIDNLLGQTVEAPPAPLTEVHTENALERIAGSLEVIAAQQARLDALTARLDRMEALTARLAHLEASQGDSRRAALLLAVGILIGVLLVLAGVAIAVGVMG
jgi:DNA-binding transcriptional MerR regulator